MRLARIRIARSCQILITALSGTASLLAGCNECSQGETRCDGNTYMSCEYDADADFEPIRWRRDTCPVACREVAGHASCVDTVTPVPECAGGDDDICVDDVPTGCLGGYPIHHSRCEGLTHCFAGTICGGDRGQRTAICAIDANAPPSCSGNPACYGGVLTSCDCGLVVAREDCGGVDFCRTVGGLTRCTATAAPDPRCGDPTKSSSSFCDGNTAVGCGYGYTWSATDCASIMYTCRVTGGQATCEDPSR